ncbi:ORF139 [White spot syndrome virus]|uniref:ORF139 n=1 Tax=White spot syndrome virus TaxID=342409 RepID=Q91LA6_9VIRU|nr:ORF139 [White spot syndrome virus]
MSWLLLLLFEVVGYGICSLLEGRRTTVGDVMFQYVLHRSVGLLSRIRKCIHPIFI